MPSLTLTCADLIQSVLWSVNTHRHMLMVTVQDTGALGAKWSQGMVAGTGSTRLAALMIMNIHSSNSIQLTLFSTQ